jgi:hypothetical protein
LASRNEDPVLEAGAGRGVAGGDLLDLLFHGLAEVLVGVDRGVADADLVVEVGAGAAAG